MIDLEYYLTKEYLSTIEIKLWSNLSDYILLVQ